MLYLWEVGGCDIDSAVQALGQIEPPESSAGAEAHRFGEALARGTLAHLTAIDGLVADRAEHWRPSRMAVLDRLILRLAVHELLHLETPPAVVIDEAIELAKRYSTDDSARFVNGVLDAIKRQIGR